MKFALSLLTAGALFLLPSCCDTEAYEAQLQSWVSRSEVDLVSYWGAPQSVYTINKNTKLFTYKKVYEHTVSGRPASYTKEVTKEKDRYGKTKKERYIYDPGTPDYNYTTECVTSFTLQHNKVIAWKHEGEECCG